jgi:hypothetical protein
MRPSTFLLILLLATPQPDAASADAASADAASADAASADAMPEESVTLELFVHGAYLHGEDVELYQAQERALEELVRRYENQPQHLAAEVKKALERIEAFERLPEGARQALGSHLQTAAFEGVDTRSPTIDYFLSSDDPILVGIALSRLSRVGDGRMKEDGELRERILDIFTDSTADPGNRTLALWVFKSSDTFEHVWDDALEVARSSSDLDFAHRVGEELTFSLELEDEQHRQLIERLFRSETGVLQWQAAIRIAERAEGAELMQRAVTVLEEVAKDAAQPPWVRGEAIEAIGRHPERPQNRKILLELLEPVHWFFGAHGHHAPVHSLALLVDALSWLDDPEVVERLTLLRQNGAPLDHR